MLSLNLIWALAITDVGLMSTKSFKDLQNLPTMIVYIVEELDVWRPWSCILLNTFHKNPKLLTSFTSAPWNLHCPTPIWWSSRCRSVGWFTAQRCREAKQLLWHINDLASLSCILFFVQGEPGLHGVKGMRGEPGHKGDRGPLGLPVSTLGWGIYTLNPFL